MRRRLAVVACLLPALLWPVVARAQPQSPEHPPEQVVLSGDVLVAKGHVVGEVVVFHGSVTVNGVVEGDVVVVSGPVTIAGQVSGDVVAIDGDVKLQSTAQVAGDVRASGTVAVQKHAQVGGKIVHHTRFTLASTLDVLGVLLASAAMAVSILVVGLLIVVVAPRGADRVASAARTAPFASSGWGVTLLVAIPTVAVAATASILGIPLGLALLLGMGLLWLLGLGATTFVIGRAVIRAPRSRVGALFVGWAIGSVVGLVPVLNLAWWTLGGLFGLGATTVAVWRTRGHARHRLGGLVHHPAHPPHPLVHVPDHEEPSIEPAETPPAED
jgi:cytoskeletal protein CcmA (bactofilin family)